MPPQQQHFQQQARQQQEQAQVQQQQHFQPEQAWQQQKQPQVQQQQHLHCEHRQEQSHPSHILTAQSALLVGSQCSGLGPEIETWIADSDANDPHDQQTQEFVQPAPPFSPENTKAYIGDGTEFHVPGTIL